MSRTFSSTTCGAAIAAGAILLAAGLSGWQGGVSPVAAAEQTAPSEVSVGGVTLRSVKVDLPDSDRRFEGPGADVVNNNCLACHSAGMILTQSRLTHAVWQAEVEKMQKAYKAPVEAADVPAIVDYLATLPR